MDEMSERTGEVVLQYEPNHYAERLRIRRGQTMRVTSYDGEVTDYRVNRVSMPDESGRVRVALTV